MHGKPTQYLNWSFIGKQNKRADWEKKEQRQNPIIPNVAGVFKELGWLKASHSCPFQARDRYQSEGQKTHTETEQKQNAVQRSEECTTQYNGDTNQPHMSEYTTKTSGQDSALHLHFKDSIRKV